MITRKMISRAIEQKHGLYVSVFSGGGCHHFYASEDENGYSIDEQLASRLAMCHSTTVLVYRLNHLSLDQWVEAFEEIYSKYLTEGAE